MSEMSRRAAKPVGAYSHAKRAGNLLFLAGIGPRTRETNEIPGLKLDPSGKILSYDFRAQCQAVFQNVRYVLEDCGSSWEKIVDVLVFLTDMKADFPVFNEMWGQHFGQIQPTRTTIEVTSLPTPIAVELKVTATID